MKTNDESLKLAAIHIGTYALGPGYRAVLWVQGCPFSCKGCISPEWTLPGGTPASIPEIADQVLQESSIEGITFSGGEPMAQAGPLSKLLRIIKKEKPEINVICFTGYKYEILLKKADKKIMEFLQQIDLLIDGPYIDELNEGFGLRGSSNQRFIHLTNRLVGFPFEKIPRKLELHMVDGEALIIGIPPKSFNDAWQEAILTAKQEMGI
jgi:anaerobic ribonucleoside-triphosphate reductase activating protein